MDGDRETPIVLSILVSRMWRGPGAPLPVLGAVALGGSTSGRSEHRNRLGDNGGARLSYQQGGDCLGGAVFHKSDEDSQSLLMVLPHLGGRRSRRRSEHLGGRVVRGSSALVSPARPLYEHIPWSAPLRDLFVVVFFGGSASNRSSCSCQVVSLASCRTPGRRGHRHQDLSRLWPAAGGAGIGRSGGGEQESGGIGVGVSIDHRRARSRCCRGRRTRRPGCGLTS